MRMEQQIMMDSLPDQFHALIIGASGTIGAAFVDLLSDSPRCACAPA